MDWSEIVIKGLGVVAAIAGAVAALLNWLRPRNRREEGSDTSPPIDNSTRPDNSMRIEATISGGGDVKICNSFKNIVSDKHGK